MTEIYPLYLLYQWDSITLSPHHNVLHQQAPTLTPTLTLTLTLTLIVLHHQAQPIVCVLKNMLKTVPFPALVHSSNATQAIGHQILMIWCSRAKITMLEPALEKCASMHATLDP